MKRILISNDDGIASPGLAALVEALTPLAEVWVVAPDRERSAISQAISLHRPLRAQQVRPRAFAVDGTPVDCVYLALAQLLPEQPDLVFSGVNLGANLGQDVFYSGTVGAAMEAVVQGVQSVAISLDTMRLDTVGRTLDEGLQTAAQFATRMASKLLVSPLPHGTLLNVNVPAKVEGAVLNTRLGRRHYGKEVTVRKDPRGKTYYWIGGARAEFADIEGSDCNAMFSGQISVTPLRVDLNHEELLASFSSMEW